MFLRKLRWCVLALGAVIAAPAVSRADVFVTVNEVDANGNFVQTIGTYNSLPGQNTATINGVSAGAFTINTFGSMRRMAMALGVNHIDEIANKISKLIQLQPPKTFKDKIQLAGELIKLAGLPPKIVNDGACHEVIQREPVTLQLRYLQTLTEIATEKNSTIVFPLPIDTILPLFQMLSREHPREAEARH